MRLYVTGRAYDPCIRTVEDRLDHEGHLVFDSGSGQGDAAHTIEESDALVLVWHPEVDLLSEALIEVGIALESRTPVVLLSAGRLPANEYWALPSVHHVTDVDVLVRVLRGLWSRTTEPPSGRARELPV